MLNIGSKSRLLTKAALIVVALLFVSGLALYPGYSRGSLCTRCHEIWQPYTDWRTSAHRDVACADCHGSVFTVQAGFHLKNMRRMFRHLRGDVEKPRLKTAAVLEMVPRCQKCHRQEFADWRSGPHSVTYADMFLNAKYNRQQLLADDCLRCHGMHFQGGIRELVVPLNKVGPWHLLPAGLVDQPAVPCLACHQMHREGVLLGKSTLDQPTPGPRQEINRPSISLFDRRSQDHIPVAELPMPAILEGKLAVKISPDQRQALCYQCHAPLAAREVGSGDDRTPLGVHQGLSCFACHSNHDMQTRASCATCHPQLSNCGRPVETMDTTFKDRASKHNVHTVKCLDCHTKGVPKKKTSSSVVVSRLGPRPPL